jgi:hypothetical protein
VALLDTVGHEVEAPLHQRAGGGGVRVHIGEVLGVLSTLIPRSAVHPDVTILGGAHVAA